MNNFFDFRETVFDNGFKLISIKRDTLVASVNLVVKIGSLYEGKEEKGISHFVEHMLFKGTKTKNNEVLNKHLEYLGGDYNAYTDYISTVFSTNTLNCEVENSINLLSDMAMNSTFDDDELKKEKGVILAEIRSSKDDIEDYSFRLINNIAFKKSSLRYDTMGEEDTVNNFTSSDLRRFYEKNYIPNNSFIVVVSSYEHEDLIKIVSKYFKNWRRKNLPNKEIIIEDNIPIKKISSKRDIEQSTIMYLYNFHNLSKDKELILKILNHKFGESSNSILFRELRENRGLAYDVYTYLDLTKGVKSLYLYASVSKQDVNMAIDVIDKCINDVKNEVITFDDDSINLMKKILKTSVAATVEDSSALSSYVLSQILEGEDICKFREDMENLKNINKNDIYNVAREVFKNPTIHILKEED